MASPLLVLNSHDTYVRVRKKVSFLMFPFQTMYLTVSFARDNSIRTVVRSVDLTRNSEGPHKPQTTTRSSKSCPLPAIYRSFYSLRRVVGVLVVEFCAR